MTDKDREWIQEGFQRAMVYASSKSFTSFGNLTWEHWAYYYLVGWFGLLPNGEFGVEPLTHHDGEGIF